MVYLKEIIQEIDDKQEEFIKLLKQYKINDSLIQDIKLKHDELIILSNRDIIFRQYQFNNEIEYIGIKQEEINTLLNINIICNEDKIDKLLFQEIINKQEELNRLIRVEEEIMRSLLNEQIWYFHKHKHYLYHNHATK